MKDIKNWFTRCISIIKMDFKNLLKKLGVYASISFTIYTIIIEIMDKNLHSVKLPNTIRFFMSNIWIYFIITFIFFFITEFCKSEYKIKIDGDHNIILSINDFFDNLDKYKDANCVFGVNDSFNCEPSKLVSNSIHYQFIKKKFNGSSQYNIHQNNINECLKSKYTPNEGVFNDLDTRHYDHGTVCLANFDIIKDPSMDSVEGRYAFMIANSRLQSNSKSYSMLEPLINYPENIWSFINKYGTSSHTLLLALIGTSSNTGQVSKNDVAIQIIDEYFKYISDGVIKNIVISIPTDSFINKELDIITIRNYVEAKIFIYKNSNTLSFSQTQRRKSPLMSSEFPSISI